MNDLKNCIKNANQMRWLKMEATVTDKLYGEAQALDCEESKAFIIHNLIAIG